MGGSMVLAETHAARVGSLYLSTSYCQFISYGEHSTAQLWSISVEKEKIDNNV